MLFGVYYITSIDEKLPLLNKVYSGETELMYATEVKNELDLRQLARVRVNGKIMETTAGRIIFNKVLPEGYDFINDAMDKRELQVCLPRC